MQFAEPQIPPPLLLFHYIDLKNHAWFLLEPKNSLALKLVTPKLNFPNPIKLIHLLLRCGTETKLTKFLTTSSSVTAILASLKGFQHFSLANPTHLSLAATKQPSSSRSSHLSLSFKSSNLAPPIKPRHQGGLHLFDAVIAHPNLAPSSHWEIILDSQVLYATAQDWGLLKARTCGLIDGSSGGPAGMGPRRSGIGRSNLIVVADAEYSSRFCGIEGFIILGCVR